MKGSLRALFHGLVATPHKAGPIIQCPEAYGIKSLLLPRAPQGPSGLSVLEAFATEESIVLLRKQAGPPSRCRKEIRTTPGLYWSSKNRASLTSGPCFQIAKETSGWEAVPA